MVTMQLEEPRRRGWASLRAIVERLRYGEVRLQFRDGVPTRIEEARGSVDLLSEKDVTRFLQGRSPA